MRGMLVLVLLMGGWLRIDRTEREIQREAVAAIRQVRGTVKYDWEWKDGYAIPGGKPPAPAWLVDLIGVDYFGHVTHVCLWHMSETMEAQVGRAHWLTEAGFLWGAVIACDPA